jgi:hypothetical protein
MADCRADAVAPSAGAVSGAAATVAAAAGVSAFFYVGAGAGALSSLAGAPEGAGRGVWAWTGGASARTAPATSDEMSDRRPVFMELLTWAEMW